MFSLYVVRHGQTEWNVAKRYLGRTDLSLTEQGLSEAKKLARHLTDFSFSQAYCSDMIRTRQTAELILAEQGLEPVSTCKLRELDFGKWEGLTYAEITKQYPNQAKLWAHGGLDMQPTGGESLFELTARVNSWLEELVSENPKGNVLIVTHGGPLRILLCLLLGLPAERYWQFSTSTGSLAILDIYSGQGILRGFFTNQNL